MLPTGGGKSAVWQVVVIVDPEGRAIIVIPYTLPLMDLLQSNVDKGIKSWKWKSGAEPPHDAQHIFCQPEQYKSAEFQRYAFHRSLFRLVTHKTLRNSFLASPYGHRFTRLFVDETHDAVIPHPKRKKVWRNFADKSTTSHCQRIFLTGTYPPHLKKLFQKATQCAGPVIRASTDRPEIGYHVANIHRSATAWSSTKALVKALAETIGEGEQILVFFESSEDVDRFAEQTGCAKYHSKLPATGDNKAFNLHRWDSGESKVMAATTAAAVGIDRAYIPFVIIYQSTYGLLTYAQESGRGGRRGSPSYTIVVHDDRVHRSSNVGLNKLSDPNCATALRIFITQSAKCRRRQLLETVDGPQLCRERKDKLECTQIPGCTPCDVCAPNSETALLIRGILDRVYLQFKIYPDPPCPPIAGPSTMPHAPAIAGLSKLPNIATALAPGPSEFRQIAAIADSSNESGQVRDDDDEFGDDDITWSMLSELDKIEAAAECKVCLLSLLKVIVSC